MNKINVGLAVLIVAMLGACGDPEPPEVNDENCKNKTVSKWADETDLPKEQIWQFTAQCRKHRMQLPEINEENCRGTSQTRWVEALEAKGFEDSFMISVGLRVACRDKGFGEPEKVW